jgi:signal recognition particle subunit SRP54
MFKSLGDSINLAIKKLKGQDKINELNVASTVKEIRRALIRADVNYNIAKEVTNSIKEKAIGQGVIGSISPGNLLVKIVSDELAILLGSERSDINVSGNPAVIMVAGLQGAGKTTFVYKLASRLKKSKNVLVVACDVYRPAAIDQLKILAKGIDVEVYSEDGNRDVVGIAKSAIEYAKSNSKNLVIIDTAGRTSVNDRMMSEIAELKSAVNPGEVLFVVDAMSGQDAVNTAKAFNDKLDFDGIVLTKLDGDTRGGAALSIKTVVNKPIKFISTGEKEFNLDVFHPDRMAKRILGMGDVISIVEKAQDLYDNEEAARLSKKLYKNQLDLNDFLSQIKKMKKLGGIKDLIAMIPGAENLALDSKFDKLNFEKFESIINSMTPEERANPAILNRSRVLRVANGSGTSMNEVNNLIKHFDGIKKMMSNKNKLDKMSEIFDTIKGSRK